LQKQCDNHEDLDRVMEGTDTGALTGCRVDSGWVVVVEVFGVGDEDWH